MTATATTRYSSARGPSPSSLNPVNHRFLIWNLAQRDLKAQYKNTVLGWAWTMILPIAQIAVYSIVFAIIFRATAPPMGNGHPGIFPLFVFCALVPWHLFSGAISKGSATVVGARSLFNKICMPSYIPIFGLVLGLSIQNLIEMGILLALLVVFGNASLMWFLAVLVLIPFVAFCLASAYVVGVFNAHYRDVSQILPVIIQLLMFMSAIMYPYSMIPQDWNGIPVQTIMSFNPILIFVNAFREIVYSHSFPTADTWGSLLAWTAGVVVLSVIVFRRWGRDLGEIT